MLHTHALWRTTTGLAVVREGAARLPGSLRADKHGTNYHPAAYGPVLSRAGPMNTRVFTVRASYQSVVQLTNGKRPRGSHSDLPRSQQLGTQETAHVQRSTQLRHRSATRAAAKRSAIRSDAQRLRQHISVFIDTATRRQGPQLPLSSVDSVHDYQRNPSPVIPTPQNNTDYTHVFLTIRLGIFKINSFAPRAASSLLLLTA